MLNKDAFLVENIFAKDVNMSATRDGFGVGVVEAGKSDENVFVLCADLSESTRSDAFSKMFSDRFVEVGIAEQNMVGLAGGLASMGKVPFIVSYASFNPGRNYEQIRTIIALGNANVKVCGMHAGVSVGPDGATHQMLEDIGMMRMLPNMIVINPADAEEARKAVGASAKIEAPVYIRFSRFATPVFTTPETPFSIGKALNLWKSEEPQVTILSTGSMAHRALLASRALDAEGIGTSLFNVPTIKPLDTDTILSSARQTGRVVTIEEHQVAGGFGSAVAEFLSQKYPVSMRMLGVHDQFGQSGEPDELLTHYGLSVGDIINSVREIVRES